MPVIVTGILFLLVGLALAAGGGWLAALGSSWYAAAAAFLVTGGLLVARRAAALWVYALLVTGTLVWAVAGFDWWRLAPRGDVIVLLGVWLPMPWVTRRLGDPAVIKQRRRGC